jgi:L1 cell adhesion molecule like protein
LGGGTFDVSILTIEDGVFEVKATAGDTHLGGEDFDNNLVDFCIQDFKRKNNGTDISGNQKALGKLRVQCERAKCLVSSTIQATIEIDSLYDGIDYVCELSRARFEDLNKEYFRKSMVPVVACLRDSRMDRNDIHEIVLVGGSTRIPKIRSMIQEYFDGKELCQTINPDEAVAFGAAVQAALCAKTCPSDHKDILLLDVTPLSLGLETVGGIMTKVINRNESLPAKKCHTCTTHQDNQRGVHIQVFEGERAKTKDNRILGKFHLDGIPPMPRGKPQIEVTFDVDMNGILNVSALESSSGAAKQITINNESGRLSQTEIDRMIQEAVRYTAQDDQEKKRINARHDLENYCLSVQNSLQEDGVKTQVEANGMKKVGSSVQGMLAWLERNQSAEKAEFEAKQRELEEIANPILSKVTAEPPAKRQKAGQGL